MLPFQYPPLVGGRSTPGWFAPLATFVGFRASPSSEPPQGPGAMGWWEERTAPRAWPEDLHAHMRLSRRERYERIRRRHLAARAEAAGGGGGGGGAGASGAGAGAGKAPRAEESVDRLADGVVEAFRGPATAATATV